MTLRRLQPFGLLLFVLALAGCDGGREAPPKTQVQVVNVAPSFGAVIYRREEDTRTPSNLAFTAAEQFDYDVDTYDFNVDAQDPITGVVSRVGTFTETLEETLNYAFVLTEVPGSSPPAVRGITASYPDLATSSTESQTVFVHGGTGLPAVDAYVAAPGAVIAGLQPVVSNLAFGESSAPRNLPSGDYVVTLTTPGNPADVLFTSQTIPLAATKATVFALYSDGGQSLHPLAIAMLQDTPSVLLDQTSPAGLRVINAAADAGARDVSYNGQLLFPAVPFGELTAYSPITAGSLLPVVVTPAGNPGVIEATQNITTEATRLYTSVVAGDPGTLTSVLFLDDGRRLANVAKLRFINAAKQFASVDVFLVAPGTDITTVAAIAALLPTPEASGTFTYIPGDYEIVLRESATTNIVAGPIAVHLDERSLYTVLVTNGADATTAGTSLLEDFP